MNERDELIWAARRGLEGLMSSALKLREETVRVADAVEKAEGHELHLMGSAEQCVSDLIHLVKSSLAGMETDDEKAAAWRAFAVRAKP